MDKLKKYKPQTTESKNNLNKPLIINKKESAKINLKSFETNIKIHLNSYIWCSKIMAEHMVKNKINGSIIGTVAIIIERVSKKQPRII